jgi:NADH:ubiquinone oxidoreductase subunit 5 (subunit L)/multisubunit Na+/H+ antiporter MnhA subunit
MSRNPSLLPRSCCSCHVPVAPVMFLLLLSCSFCSFPCSFFSFHVLLLKEHGKEQKEHERSKRNIKGAKSNMKRSPFMFLLLMLFLLLLFMFLLLLSCSFHYQEQNEHDKSNRSMAGHMTVRIFDCLSFATLFSLPYFLRTIMHYLHRITWSGVSCDF